jgi:hypothetical protein
MLNLEKWIESRLYKYKQSNSLSPMDETELLNFLSSYDKNLEFLSVADALKKTKESLEKKAKEIKKERDGLGYENYIQYKDGYSWKRILDEETLKKEGTSMKNCVGIYDPFKTHMYVLHNEKNESLIHLNYYEPKNSILQIKGCANSSPNQNLYPRIKDFMDKKGVFSLEYQSKDWIINNKTLYFLNDLPENLHYHGSWDMSSLNLDYVKWPKKMVVTGNLIIDCKHFQGKINSEIQANKLILKNYRGQELRGMANSVKYVDCVNVEKLSSEFISPKVESNEVDPIKENKKNWSLLGFLICVLEIYLLNSYYEKLSQFLSSYEEHKKAYEFLYPVFLQVYNFSSGFLVLFLFAFIIFGALSILVYFLKRIESRFHYTYKNFLYLSSFILVTYVTVGLLNYGHQVGEYLQGKTIVVKKDIGNMPKGTYYVDKNYRFVNKETSKEFEEVYLEKFKELRQLSKESLDLKLEEAKELLVPSYSMNPLLIQIQEALKGESEELEIVSPK